MTYTYDATSRLMDSVIAANSGRTWLSPLFNGIVFWKMKNKPIDSGPLNKNFQQPPEEDPTDKILEEIEEKASKVRDFTDVLLDLIRNLPRGGTFVEVPMFMVNPCGGINPYQISCGSGPSL